MNDAIDLEKAIYYEAIAIQDPGRRAAYLQATCQHDAKLLQRVKSLLDADERVGTFLGDSPLDVLADRSRPSEPLDAYEGSTIGRYKLLEKIGEGGFGAVYMTDQLEPIRRRLAFKIIKAGMDTKQVVARFEAERQALALMDHPNIAKVFDAGATDKGRPYFVMELVRGVTVTKYCDERRLSTDARLNIFVEICAAVQHAHQKGIIHRDIKPSNILVSTNGDRPVPKVIDFGIAKATQGTLTDRTLFTHFRQFIGTPAYMSPEQAQMSPVDVDTRTDIYSLGVLLYELLTGKTPLDSHQLRHAGIEEISRRIREDTAQTPSKRVSSLDKVERTTLAKHRQIDPERFSTRLRGEIDWIVMKAVEKERLRRYATADALAADVMRYLNKEPLSAGPPNPLYRIRKYAARHRVAVLATSVVVCALLAGSVASTIGFLRAVRAQKESEQALTITQAARAEAELNVYVLNMNRAYQAYEDADVPLALAILDRYRETRGDHFESRCLRWLCETGDALHTLRGHTDTVNSVAISRDGLLASCAADGRLLLHALDTRAEIESWKHSTGLRRLAFTPNGQNLALVDDQGQLMIWQVRPWQFLKGLPVRPGRINDVTFSPNGRLLAVSVHPNLIETWNWDAGELQTTLTSQYAAVGLEFSPAGDLLAGAADGPGIHLWDTSRPAGELWGMISRAHSSYTTDVTFSRPDGQHLASSSWDGVIKVWEVAAIRGSMAEEDQLHPLTSFRGHRRNVRSLAVSPDGMYLASASVDNTIRLWPFRPPWNFVPESVATLRGHTAAVTDVEYSCDGELLVSGSADQSIKIWSRSVRPATNVLLGHNDWVFDVAFSPDGRLLASGAFDGEVCLWNTSTREREFARKLHRHQVLRVIFSPDGRLLASCDGIWQLGRRSTLDASMPGTVRLLDIETQTSQPVELPSNAAVRTIAFSPDGRFLAVGDYEGWLWKWDVSLKTFPDPVHVGEGIVNGLQYSPDGSMIVASSQTLGGSNRKLTCFNAADLEQISQLDGTSAWRLAFAPVSLGTALLAVPSQNGVEFFDVSSGIQRVRRLNSFDSASIAVYSPDGKSMATAGDDTVRLWNVESGGEVAKLAGHRGLVTGLTFSRDGKMLASSSEDRSIRLWQTMSFADRSNRLPVVSTN